MTLMFQENASKTIKNLLTSVNCKTIKNSSVHNFIEVYYYYMNIIQLCTANDVLTFQ